MIISSDFIRRIVISAPIGRNFNMIIIYTRLLVGYWNYEHPKENNLLWYVETYVLTFDIHIF